MVLLKETMVIAAALLQVLALASAGVGLHEDGIDVRSAGHAGCDACHCRHPSAVETDGVPAASVLDLVAHTVASTHPDGELGKALVIHPTRGPPA